MWNVKPENRFWIGIYAFTAFILLVAVCVFAWLAWTSYDEPGVGRVAGARPPATSAAISDEQYQLWAEFEAPAYLAEHHAPKAFQNVMALYTAGDFKGAVPQLQAIVNANPRLTAAHFYLAISFLKAGDHISGIQELSEIIQAGKTPYLERAQFYLAKGLLGEHDLPRAQTQLNNLIAEHGSLEPQATALLTQIRSSS
ncbi:MAG TPA: hypothetical protein VME17_20870 [Bryobacteraceae bacterium]|nr:hypothetical protein [Bryobacteraceae bacterium]